MTMRMLWLVLFAWVLWVDQSAYQLSGGDTGAPIVAEGARSSVRVLAVTDNRGQCEALRAAAIRDAAAGAGTNPGHYRAQDRYFCSPAQDVPGK